MDRGGRPGRAGQGRQDGRIADRYGADRPWSRTTWARGRVVVEGRRPVLLIVLSRAWRGGPTHSQIIVFHMHKAGPAAAAAASELPMSGLNLRLPDFCARSCSSPVPNPYLHLPFPLLPLPPHTHTLRPPYSPPGYFCHSPFSFFIAISLPLLDSTGTFRHAWLLADSGSTYT